VAAPATFGALSPLGVAGRRCRRVATAGRARSPHRRPRVGGVGGGGPVWGPPPVSDPSCLRRAPPSQPMAPSTADGRGGAPSWLPHRLAAPRPLGGQSRGRPSDGPSTPSARVASVPFPRPGCRWRLCACACTAGGAPCEKGAVIKTWNTRTWQTSRWAGRRRAP